MSKAGGAAVGTRSEFVIGNESAVSSSSASSSSSCASVLSESGTEEEEEEFEEDDDKEEQSGNDDDDDDNEEEEDDDDGECSVATNDNKEDNDGECSVATNFKEEPSILLAASSWQQEGTALLFANIPGSCSSSGSTPAAPINSAAESIIIMNRAAPQQQRADADAIIKAQQWKLADYNRFVDEDNGYHVTVHRDIIYLTGLESATHEILNQHDIKWYLPESDLRYPKECDFCDASDRHPEVIRFLIRLYDCISAYAAQREVSPELIYIEGLNNIDRLDDLKCIRK